MLDTWFSSGLWPFSTLGWPDETRELKTFYPTTMLETGYDILFFWVARMMMMGLHFMGKVPFRTRATCTRMVTDENGEKMTKVKGNVIDPLDVIDQHGADALRFTLAWLTTSAAQGKNIKFAISNVEDARRFANKIWNATRFALMNLEGYDADRFADRIADGPDRAELDLPERWILSRVQRASEDVDAALEEYRIADAAQAAYHFVWGELCDWYIELAKAGFQRAGTDPEARSKIQGALVTALETAMRLLHPFMPFLTEEIWQQLPKPTGHPAEHHDHAVPGARRALPRRRVGGVDGAGAEDHRRGARHPHRTQDPDVGAADGAAGGHRRLQEDDPRRLQDDHRRAGALRRGARPPQRRQLLGRVRAQAIRRWRWRATSRCWCRSRAWSTTRPNAPSWTRISPSWFRSATTSRASSSNKNFVDRAPLEVLDKVRARLAEVEAAIAKIEEALKRLG